MFEPRHKYFTLFFKFNWQGFKNFFQIFCLILTHPTLQTLILFVGGGGDRRADGSVGPINLF